MEGEAALILADGTEFRLDEETLVGRGDENDLALDRTNVSRQHARFVPRDGRWFVEDRGSFNGTFVNGVRIPPGVPMVLRHTDRIGIGSELLLFSWPEQRSDDDTTEPIDELQAMASTRPLSSFQLQVVRCLCAPWLAGGTLDELPTNEAIAAQLGTPGAADTVKAALRRAYAKAGLTSGAAYVKRRALCRVARQRGWI